MYKTIIISWVLLFSSSTMADQMAGSDKNVEFKSYSCKYKGQYPSSPYKNFSYSYDAKNKQLYIVDHPDITTENGLQLAYIVDSKEKLSFILATSADAEESLEMSYQIFYEDKKIEVIESNRSELLTSPLYGKCSPIDTFNKENTDKLIMGEATSINEKSKDKKLFHLKWIN